MADMMLPPDDAFRSRISRVMLAQALPRIADCRRREGCPPTVCVFASMDTELMSRVAGTQAKVETLAVDNRPTALLMQ